MLHQTTPQRPLQATDAYRQMMSDYFYRLDRIAAGEEEGKVAWCSSVGPVELLRSFGFETYFPENHAAILGAKRLAVEYIPAANAIGYSPEICSYLTSDIGAYLKRETPLTKSYPGIAHVPPPSVLVYNTNQCREIQDWFRFYGDQFAVPVLGITPPRALREVRECDIANVAAQMMAMVPSLEAVSGRRFDVDKLRYVLGLSRQCSDLWKEVLGLAKAIPSPWTFFDACIHVGAAVCLRGTQLAVDYYRLLKEELEVRVSRGVGAVEDERFRLYWDGMPIWGKLRSLSEHFRDLHTSVVASTYCYSYVNDAFDPDHPFESMAEAYTQILVNRDEPAKEASIEQLADDFQVDGLVFHDARTCANMTNSRFGMPQRLAGRLGKPVLVIDGDLNDGRLFSEEQTRTRIETFVEQLEAGRSAGAVRLGRPGEAVTPD
jgi:benzoyl-CoA reductase/2-hydroxyglutaryl-CoA dehydratase subunit BcrC/BadD/HgdB